MMWVVLWYLVVQSPALAEQVSPQLAGEQPGVLCLTVGLPGLEPFALYHLALEQPATEELVLRVLFLGQLEREQSALGPRNLVALALEQSAPERLIAAPLGPLELVRSDGHCSPAQAQQDFVEADHLELEQTLGLQASAVQHGPTFQLDHLEHQSREPAVMVFHQLVEALVLVPHPQDDQPSEVLSLDHLAHRVSEAVDCSG